MKLSEIAKVLNAKVVCGQDRLDEEQDKAFASDLMSDILTLGDNFPMIVTGLCTMQTIRTCEMGNLDIVVFVRKKKPTQEMIELAEDEGMVLMECEYSMFKTCGLLWEAGLKPIY
ncbi:MAG: hypothetical protein IK004_09770 [Bacteroidales bacterium]|nr:hypothetical protein [Bacteroidales bacterium]